MSPLDYLRRANFTFTRQLGSVWNNDPHDVPELHARVRRDILARAETSAQATETPLGLVLKGDAGAGKTHLLGELRRLATERGMLFLYVDMTDVRDFARTLLLGITESLYQEASAGTSQLRHVLASLFVEAERIRGLSVPFERGLAYAAEIADLDEFALPKAANSLVDTLWKRHRAHLANPSADIIRALVGLNNDVSSHLWSLASSWLQGSGLDDFDGQKLKLAHASLEPWKLVKGLFWVLRFRGPTLLCFDQLDNCFPLLEAARSAPDLEEGKTAKLVLGEIGRGFGALRDHLNPATLAVVACFGGTWDLLKTQVPASFTDRYTEPHRLFPVTEASVARDLVAKRLASARGAFAPPSPTWPFAPEFFASAAHLSPREILRLCERHREACLARDEVRELRHAEANPFLDSTPIATTTPAQSFDEQLARHREKIDLPALLADSDDAENALGDLAARACELLAQELLLPANTFFEVERAAGGRHACPSIHLRLKRIVSGHGGVDEEWHVCLRALLRKHHAAYNNRLRAAMTESGIDRNLSRRRLVILRTFEAPPSGPVGIKLTEDFLRAGGCFVPPAEGDVRTLAALAAEIADAPDAGAETSFRDWLRERKPLSATGIFRSLLDGWLDDPATPSATAAPLPPLADVPPVSPTPERVTLGSAHLPDRAQLSVDDLARHVVVLAGSGSGKTVLLKRLVEEAALAGIPSVVIDSAGDLAQLGDRWPQPPAGWDPEDARRAESYFQKADLKVWTPGRMGGRPFVLQAMPDFGAVRDDADAFALATAMTLETLTELAAIGGGAKAKRMAGVLAAALGAFGQAGGGDIHAFLAFLRDLPAAVAGEFSAAEPLAREAADNLRSSMLTNPLLFGDGTPLDPNLLFGSHEAPHRVGVSVISLIGIPGERDRQTLLGHLALSLFTWARRHPPTDKPGHMNGLIVLDEAKDFLPSVRTTACKQGLLRLAAQGRKYGLGLVLATQNPKDLDGAALSNVGTWFCGRANMPRTIAQIQAFLEERGANAAEIATLPNGAFQFSSPLQGTPRRVQIPMCLSHHPDRAPLTEEEVLERARR